MPANPHPTSADARRMADLLTAYGEIKASRYCEILVAAALGAKSAGANPLIMVSTAKSW